MKSTITPNKPVSLGDESPNFTIDEVAELLSCSRRHIYNLIEEGCLAAIKPTAKKITWRISAESYEMFTTSREKKAK